MPVKIEKNPLRRSVHVSYNGEADTYTLRPGVVCGGAPRAVYGTNHRGALHALINDYGATHTCAEGILTRASVAEHDEYLYAFQVGSDAFTSSAEAVGAGWRPEAVMESDEAVDVSADAESGRKTVARALAYLAMDGEKSYSEGDPSADRTADDELVLSGQTFVVLAGTFREGQRVAADELGLRRGLYSVATKTEDLRGLWGYHYVTAFNAPDELVRFADGRAGQQVSWKKVQELAREREVPPGFVLVDVVERESGFPDAVRVTHHRERPRHGDHGDRAPRVIVPEVLVAEYERHRKNAMELGSMVRLWAHKIPGEGV
jgi:hypothetical protein